MIETIPLPTREDGLHVAMRFPSDNAWGIPALLPVSLSHLPALLVPFGQRIRTDRVLTDACWHFFLDDYRFERAWSRPRRTLAALQTVGWALTPDFSLYRTMPLAAQLWNTYRNRWCGAFWAAHGITVIPTIAWGGAASYEFCFAGIVSHSVVAVSTVGILGQQEGDRLKQALFVAGYREMVARLQPSHVLCYGDMLPECEVIAPFTCYPTRWQSIRQARKTAQARAGVMR